MSKTRHGKYLVSDDAALIADLLESIKDKLDEHNGNMRDLIDAVNTVVNAVSYAADNKHSK